MADDIKIVADFTDLQLMRRELVGVSKDAKASAAVFEREFNKVERQLRKNKKEFDDNVKASQRYYNSLLGVDKATKSAANSATIFERELNKVEKATKRAEAAQERFENTSRKGMRRTEIIAQQAGYQIGDLAVQIQSGTNAAVAFGQQGSQLLGFFGPMGALAGAGLAISTAFIAPFIKAKEKAKDFYDLVEQKTVQLEMLRAGIEDKEAFENQKKILATRQRILDVETRLAQNPTKDRKELAEKTLAGLREELATLEQNAVAYSDITTAISVSERLSKEIVQNAERQAKEAETIAEEQQKAAEQAERMLRLKSLELNLLEAERKYGKDSYEYAKIAYDVEQARYRATLENGNYTKGQIRDLIAANGKVLQAKYRISEEDKNSQDLLNTILYQYSMVEGELKQIKAEQEALNKEAEKLGDHLGIGFERALEIILRAKEEAAMGLDPFGGYGSFKYGTSTTVEPDKTTRTKRDPLADLQKQVELEQALIGKTQARQRIIQALGVDLSDYNDKTINNLEAQINRTIMLEDAERKRQEAVEEAKRQQEDLAQSIGDSFESAFMSIVDGTKSVEDAFRTMASEIIKELYRVFVVKQITGFITNAVGAAMAGPVQGPMLPSANGNVFSRGSLVPYANGGIVGSPTLFPMAGGRTGLMGEAGPEAIMPLKRGKGGKLGVAVEGGQQPVVINQSFNFAANGDDSVKRIIAQQAPKIAQMTQQQIMDSRRRGGQMKAVFG